MTAVPPPCTHSKVRVTTVKLQNALMLGTRIEPGLHVQYQLVSRMKGFLTAALNLLKLRALSKMPQTETARETVRKTNTLLIGNNGVQQWHWNKVSTENDSSGLQFCSWKFETLFNLF